MIEIFKVILFEQERKIRVYLPDTYNKAKNKYPVLYMHDGQNVFDNKEAIGGISLELHKYLERNKLDIIVVAIDRNSANEERINEYCPWINGVFSKNFLGSINSTGGKGKDYVHFIVSKLKPLIDKKYRTNVKQTWMAGISLGGLISTYAACCYPQIFKRIAAVSPAYYRNQEDIETLLKTSDISSIERFYLDCGTMEAKGNTNISELFLLSNKVVYEIAKDKGVKIKFNIIDEAEHSYKEFKKRLPEFIRCLTS